MTFISKFVVANLIAFTLLVAPQLGGYAEAAETGAPIPPKSGTAGSDFGLGSAAGFAGLKTGAPEVIIGRIILSLLTFVGLIAFVLVIYAGGLWMTASGNEKQVEKAKDILKNAVIGLIIIFTSYAIATFIIATIAPQTLQ